MHRRQLWFSWLGVCALWAACGPAEAPEETQTQEAEALARDAATLDATRNGGSHRCEPPVFAADLTPGAAGSDIRAIHDLNGTPLVNVYNLDRNSLWKLVERKRSPGEAPSWEAVLLKGDFGLGQPLLVAFSFGRTLYFSADDGVHGVELWKTDGTPEGTVMVGDLYPGGGNSYPGNFVVLGGKLYFTADDGAHGRELWTTDGTSEGTRLVVDINPGPASASPSYFAEANSHKLLFVADDGTHGREPWKTDGTASGTRLLADVYPGPEGSEPGAFFSPGAFSVFFEVGNHKFLFVAGDGTHGR